VLQSPAEALHFTAVQHRVAAQRCSLQRQVHASAFTHLYSRPFLAPPILTLTSYRLELTEFLAPASSVAD
jgi:hypothetical protein